MQGIEYPNKRRLRKMKKKMILGAVLSTSLAIIIAVAALVPALAVSSQALTQLKTYGTGGMVNLNLPPPPNATSPPAAPGTPSRPSDIQLRVADFDSRSFNGAHDSIFVYLWIPQRNSYNLVAIITDQANTDTDKMLWNGTFAWYTTMSNPDANIQNIIQVKDKDLDVWTDAKPSGYENGNWGYDQNGAWGFQQWSAAGHVLTVNLTTSVTINLPFNLWPQPIQSYGNLTFTLPPMTLTFREIGDSYFDGGSNFTLTSKYVYLPVAGMRTPAWVEERIPSWIGAASPLEVTGHIDWQYSQTYTPLTP